MLWPWADIKACVYIRWLATVWGQQLGPRREAWSPFEAECRCPDCCWAPRGGCDPKVLLWEQSVQTGHWFTPGKGTSSFLQALSTIALLLLWDHVRISLRFLFWQVRVIDQWERATFRKQSTLQNRAENTCDTDSLMRKFSLKNPFERNVFVVPALSEWLVSWGHFQWL